MKLSQRLRIALRTSLADHGAVEELERLFVELEARVEKLEAVPPKSDPVKPAPAAVVAPAPVPAQNPTTPPAGS